MTDSAIAQLENRLKTVTARLEQVEKQLAAGGGGGGGGGGSSSSSSSSGGGGGGGSSAYLSAYDNLISTYIDKYVELSAQIDPLVAKQAESVRAAVNAQRQFLSIASQSRKPSPNEIPNLLRPTSEQIEKVSEIRNANRAHKTAFNYLSTLSEGITALGWVVVEPAPGPSVAEARASSEFYSNKILMEYKNKEGGDLHRAWVHSWNEFLKELQNYIKQYHTTGVSYNPQGGSASSADVGPPPPSGAGPAPPPSGPPPPTDSGSSHTTSQHSDRGALLAQINLVAERQKGGKTEGLRKVQAHEKTKNRDPKDQVAVVKSVEQKGTPSKAAAGRPVVTKPPRIELESNKWIIEWQNGNKNIVISETETRQTVYIFKCENSVIQIKGKVNSIAIDSCRKTAIVFDNAIATVEAVNCQSIELQVTGRVPNISVDKTDGCQLHLSKECLEAEIITSKVSEMNITIPNPKGDHEDPVERPVPEQFKTTVKGTSLETLAVQHLA